jgi:LIVCS family branched-chain amino acid:cation transporter
VAFAGVESFLPGIIPMVLFALVYTIATWWVVQSRSRMIDILGSILTPLLILFLGIIIIKGIFYDATVASSTYSTGELLKLGLVEGYNTMDLIGAFFFSASIITLVRENGADLKSSIRLAFKSSLIGIGLLGIIYLGMVYVAAANREVLLDISKVNLMPHMAKTFLGDTWGGLAAGVMILACFTTSVAVVSVFSDFLHSVLLKEKFSRTLSTTITSIVVFFVSMTGLEGITKITSPALQVFYPILIILIIGNVSYDLIKKKMLK